MLRRIRCQDSRRVQGDGNSLREINIL